MKIRKLFIIGLLLLMTGCSIKTIQPEAEITVFKTGPIGAKDEFAQPLGPQLIPKPH